MPAQGAEGSKARGVHEAGCFELGDALDVDLAPLALGLVRREADGEAVLVEHVADAVDPAEAESFVEGFLVAGAAALRMHLEEAEGQLRSPTRGFSGARRGRRLGCGRSGAWGRASRRVREASRA